MLTYESVVIDNKKTLGEKMFLVSVSPKYVYVDRVKTDMVKGYYYKTVLADRGFETVKISIDGEKKLDLPADASAVPVVFDGLRLSVYVMDGKAGISAKADNVRIVKAA